jgi:hypothetical protein
MWDKEKSITDAYINSYMKLGISEEQKKYVIDAEAELTKIFWDEMTKEANIGDYLIMSDAKEDRRKYLLIRR